MGAERKLRAAPIGTGSPTSWAVSTRDLIASQEHIDGNDFIRWITGGHR